MTLDKAPVGSKVRVVNISDSPIKHRLLGIGIIPNSIIEVVHSSPMGDPRVYRIFNKLISLRHSEASNIEVELLDDYIPLSHAPDGEYIITSFLGGFNFKKKMFSFGLQIGSKLTVKNGEVFHNNNKIFLGQGMKEKILLRRA
ncbi:MAG: FeoA domain-containing protein [Thermosipho sp. (in: Bacteria)]|nr:FeoA domain-containing protein [Thermosipho sp. (in: thermotogales)]